MSKRTTDRNEKRNSPKRRMLAIEKLILESTRQVTQPLDTFIERETLKQRVTTQGAPT
jgi:hypothetical protein